MQEFITPRIYPPFVQLEIPMIMRRWLVCWPALALVGVVALINVRGLLAETSTRAAASEARLRRDITFLASDACEGRGVTTEGIRKAADYIVGEFRKAGLQPGGVDGTYFQPFTYPGAVLEAPATFSVRGPKGEVVSYKQGTDFYPMGVGYAGNVNGLPLVFAGYGITSEANPQYDDYANLDVADKVVVILRDTPRATIHKEKTAENGTVETPFATPARREALGSLARKLEAAEGNHAAAVLLVNDAATAADGDDLLDFNFTALARGRGGIPVLHIHRAVLESMLPGGAAELSKIEHGIDADLKPAGRTLEGWSATLNVKMKRDRIVMKNIIGVVEGAGALANETVIIGAHYDHLGFGGPFGNFFSSRSKPKKMIIHHGADDNGSGTTSIMELARRFGAASPGDRRRLVFIAFCGEEINLLGSAHYVKNPVFPLEKTVAMVNLDMVGRLRVDEESNKDSLHIEGSGSAKTFEALLEDVNKKYDFHLIKKAGGNGPSDHASFYGKKVPVIFAWTYYHDDYHTPADTADKINIPGMRKIVDFAGDLVANLATVEKRPEYVQVKEASPAPGGPPVPRLGIRPNYDDTEEKGVLLDGIVEDGPAAHAGIKAGDRIVEIDGKPVKNMSNYMVVMSGRKQAGTLDLVVVRGGKRIPLKVKLD
jgi:membrane-associated protease RseP (regulator of RpoE activity)